MAARQGRSRVIATVIPVAVALAFTLTGCGPAMSDPPPAPANLDLGLVDVAGTERNGIEYLTGSDALAVMIRAMRAGGPVTVSGDYERRADLEAGVAPGRITLDFAGTSSAFDAVVVVDGVVHEVRVDGLRGAVREGNGEDGVWRCVSADDADVRRWAPLLDPAAHATSLLGDGAALAVSPRRDDPAVVELLFGGVEGASGAVTVAAEGLPLPSRLIIADGISTVEFSYEGWGADVSTELPAACSR